MLLWIVIFVISLGVLIKGTDWFLEGAEEMGKRLGFSPFIVGVLIVGLGTSFPELTSSLFALYQGASDVAVANAVGSNIANILLVGGLLAFVGKNVKTTKTLLRADIPFLVIATLVLLAVAYNGDVVFSEAVVLVLMYGFYLIHTIVYSPTVEHVPISRSTKKDTALKISVGLLGLLIGAKFFIDSVIAMSVLLGLSTGVLALVFVALGTSLPELIVSIRAAQSGRGEIALGNIFGSNIFNALVVVGIPALFASLTVDIQTLHTGLSFMLIATTLFVVSSISNRFKKADGLMYILVYAYFLLQLSGLV